MVGELERNEVLDAEDELAIMTEYLESAIRAYNRAEEGVRMAIVGLIIAREDEARASAVN